jgi:hypothetical protein
MKKCFVIFLWMLMGSLVWAETIINETNHVAYGANIGWVEMRGDITNGAVMGPYTCTGVVWSANCGWISLGNGLFCCGEYGLFQ